MQTGAILPQTEIGADPADIRRYAESVERMGYKHILVYDHVLGADPAHRPGWNRYTHRDMFHEVFVLFGYLAAFTSLELVTGVLVLPQRQTALVAKQAAEVDVLSGGRLRLGVGVGWNDVEYEALGESFRNRGRRLEEQVRLLRELWTHEVLDFQGEYHRVTAAGINPLPVQRPIPVWMGGRADAVLQRIGRMGDGWFPQMPPSDTARDMVERLRQYASEAGREPSSIGIEARINISRGGPDLWRSETEGWRELGATHIGVNTMGAGFDGVEQHLDALQHYLDAVA